MSTPTTIEEYKTAITAEIANLQTLRDELIALQDPVSITVDPTLSEEQALKLAKDKFWEFQRTQGPLIKTKKNQIEKKLSLLRSYIAEVSALLRDQESIPHNVS